MTETFIYAIYNSFDQTVKIGYSQHPQKRLIQIQNGCAHKLKLLFTFVGDISTEAEIHDRLKSCRMSGEWFAVNEVLIQELVNYQAIKVSKSLQETSSYSNENYEEDYDFGFGASEISETDIAANFLESNPSYLEGFAINPETRKVEFKGKAVNEDVYGLDISSIDILSKRLSEAFNYRYSFPYKFLLPALKKALKMRNYLPTFEDIEYVEKVVTGIISGTKKSRITVGEVLKNSTGLDKKFVGNALVTLGWERKAYKSKNVVYIKKQTP